MIAEPKVTAPVPSHNSEKAMVWALRLAHAENALRMFTSGQVDAIVDPEGKTYLMQPAQEFLREKQRRLQTVIDSTPDVITVVDREGAILSNSSAVSAVLGYEPAELVGGSFFELIHEDDLSVVQSAFFEVIDGHRPRATSHFRIKAADDSFCLIEATLGKMRDVSVESVVFCLRPTAELTNDQPENSPPMKGKVPLVDKEIGIRPALEQNRFLAMISHELRTPLTPVLLGIFELQEDDRFVEARSVLAMIRRNLELESRLLEELTDFTTVGQHKVRLQIAAIDAHEHVRFALEICQSEIQAANIEVLLHLGASQSFVMADSARLQQVLWNLIKNAVKFSPPGGSIVITSANDPAGNLNLKVADHGVGIEPELLVRLFEPFQQGDLQQYGGLGLGLYIAKGLAEAQGGALTVASQGRNQGTTFCLTLKSAPQVKSSTPVF